MRKKKAAFVSPEARFWRVQFMNDRKKSANGKVAAAIKRGDLPPIKYLKCVDCGKDAFCYDHRDYRKPLKVDPVCKSCDGKRGAAEPYLFADSEEYKIALKKFKAMRYRNNR